MSLRGRHNYKKKPQKRLTRKTRYGFLKSRGKYKYSSAQEELEELRRWRKLKRVEAENRLFERRERAYEKQEREGKPESVFMFRKGSFPNRASYDCLPITIFNRSQVITEELRNRTVSIFNGYLFFNFKVTSEAVGHKFGEASPTKQWRAGITHTKKKKTKKIQKKAKTAKGSKPAQKKAKK